MEAFIVAAVVAAAVAYLAWRLWPRRTATPCGGCPTKNFGNSGAVPVRTRWGG